jgi:hypothetical protein
MFFLKPVALKNKNKSMNKQNEREPLWLLALFIFAALVGVAPLFLAACAAEKRHQFTHEQINILDELEKPL